MAQVEMHVDLSRLINAIAAGDRAEIIAAARELLRYGEQIDVLIGHIGMVAAHGDPDGHNTITLAAAAMLSRMVHFIPAPVDSSEPMGEHGLPLLVQAASAASPSIRAGYPITPLYPRPMFPSELPEGSTVNEKMHEAIYGNDAQLAERLLFGLYGSGADYRTMEVRVYDSISTTFQNAGHPLMFALRGFQLLDAVEWGDRAPNILHWLAPHLPLRPDANEPAWVQPVRNFAGDPSHSVASVRTRLAPPKDENALPLRSLVTSNTDTLQVCQGVYNALITNGASAAAVAAVIALAAADVLQRVNDEDRDLFARVAHGLLFAAAIRQVFRRVQDIEVLSLLYTSAAYVNALNKEVAASNAQPTEKSKSASAPRSVPGGGLIAAAQLEVLHEQLLARNLEEAFTTAQRYLRLNHDKRALFATIALVAAHTDASTDQGHTLQIVQAAAEEFLSWPTLLASTNHEVLLRVALRAAAFGERDSKAIY
jgi:hypothetical protein